MSVSADPAPFVPDDVMAPEYRAARERIAELVGSLDAGDESSPVAACPAWDVHDLIAHVTGIAADLSAGVLPDGDTQAWVDRQVVERRDTPLDVVLDEWARVGPVFEEMIAARPHRLWTLTYDVIAHEHDLRAAIDAPGERDGNAVAVAAHLGLRLVAADLARHGSGTFSWIDSATGDRFTVGDGEPTLTLHADPFEAFRLLGSRRTADEMRAARFEGPLDELLPGIVHMDLPTTSLRE